MEKKPEVTKPFDLTKYKEADKPGKELITSFFEFHTGKVNKEGASKKENYIYDLDLELFNNTLKVEIEYKSNTWKTGAIFDYSTVTAPKRKFNPEKEWDIYVIINSTFDAVGCCMKSDMCKSDLKTRKSVDWGNKGMGDKEEFVHTSSKYFSFFKLYNKKWIPIDRMNNNIFCDYYYTFIKSKKGK